MDQTFSITSSSADLAEVVEFARADGGPDHLPVLVLAVAHTNRLGFRSRGPRATLDQTFSITSSSADLAEVVEFARAEGRPDHLPRSRACSPAHQPAELPTSRVRER
jgi:hypothetical protein